MALIDKASLLMVPSTYEDGTLYNILPSGNKAPDETGNHNGYDQTRADFTFSRGFNLAATRVNADGLIEKGRENLFTQSNNLTHSDWEDGSNTSISSGFVDKDGGTNAFRLTMTSGIGTYFYQTKSLTNGGVYTLSFWAKANGSTHLYTSGDAGYESVPLTNEWQRFEFYFVLSTSSPSIGLDNNAAAVDCLIMNMQLEAGLVATDYIETGATTATAGVLENTPRIDYSSGAGALLLEPQRTNLLAQSEYFGGFTTTEANVTTNNGISPEGLQNASAVIETTGSSNKRILPSSPFLGTGGANYTLSVYVKKIAGQPTRHIYWMCQFGPDAIYAHFDMDDFSVNEQNDNGNGSLTNADIIPVGNDWYRLILSGSISTTGGDYYNQLYFEDTPRTGFNAQSYTGNGSSGFEIYGWQIEQGSHVSSYVPTYGSAATRGADIVDGKEDSSLYNDSEGVLFVEFSALSATRDNEFRFMISDGTNDDRIQIGLQTGGDLYASVIENNSATASFNYTLPNPTQTHKVAIKYKANDCALWVDGIERGTDISATMPSGLDVFDFYRTPNNNNYVEANVKQVIYFDEALSDSELATLTTL